MAAIDRIKHLVVLMMENRSFDHMLGFLKGPEYAINGLTGEESNPDADGKPVRVTRDAQYAGDLNPDPGHDFIDANEQIFGNRGGIPGGPQMMGFIKNYQTHTNNAQKARRIMKCFDPAKIPVLTTLAKEYAICDNWYSSVPGPTLPNRAFIHFATSMGRLDMSPDYGGNFPIIYEVLDNDKKSPEIGSRVYFNDSTIALTFTYLNRDQGRYFGEFNDFRKDCQKGRLPSYCVVEPRFSSQFDDRFAANDQHPDHGVDRGEELIKNVYTIIRSNQQVWESTMLVIVYDEHGGLYDHVPPPATVSPDDKARNTHDFKFDRLGVRVPAVIVSPYIERGTIINTPFDHTSVIATARKLFTKHPETNALTKRDQQANSLEACLKLETPRTDTVKFPKPGATPPAPKARSFALSTASYAVKAATQPNRKAKAHLSEFQRGMLQVALTIDSKLPVKEQSGKTMASIKTESDLSSFLEVVKRRMLKSAAKNTNNGKPAPKERSKGRRKK